MSWLKMRGIVGNVTLQNIDDIKNIITSKFKEKLWCDENLEDKRKLRYYKEVINPKFEYQNYLFVLIFNESHQRHNKGYLKYDMPQLNMRGIDENATLQNIDDIKNIITPKFKEKFQCNENLEDK